MTAACARRVTQGLDTAHPVLTIAGQALTGAYVEDTSSIILGAPTPPRWMTTPPHDARRLPSCRPEHVGDGDEDVGSDEEQKGAGDSLRLLCVTNTRLNFGAVPDEDG